MKLPACVPDPDATSQLVGSLPDTARGKCHIKSNLPRATCYASLPFLRSPRQPAIGGPPWQPRRSGRKKAGAPRRALGLSTW